jgi:hypothetical protein
MSELEQQKKTLSFQEICPLWHQALTGKGKSRILDLEKHKFCIVGEAHDFSDEYNPVTHRDNPKNCPECRRASYYVLGTDRGGVSDEGIAMFVKHWNEVHIK